MLTGYNKHILKYALKNPNYENEKYELEYLYSFAGYGKWVDWVQSMNERHRMNKRLNDYLHRKEKGKNSNENEVKEVFKDNGPEFKKM